MTENGSNNHYKTLRGKILAAMILAPAIPFGLVVLVGFYYFTSSLERETLSRMVRIAEDHKKSIEMFLAERKADLDYLVGAHSYEWIIQPENLREVFERLRAASPAFVDLGVFDNQGLHVAYEGPYRLAGKMYRDAKWFQEVLSRGYYISDVFLGFRNFPHFIISVSKQEGGHPWVLRATIDTMFFNDLVEKVRIGKTGEAYILNGQGEFQTERRSGGDLLETDPAKAVSNQRYPGVLTFAAEDRNGDEYIYAGAWLDGKDWQLVVRQEKSDAFKDLRAATYLVAIILALGGAGIVAMAFYLTGGIIGRLNRIDQEKSELNQQLIVASRLAEIGEMSAGFAHEINNPLQIIRAEQALAQTILDEMNEAGQLPDNEDARDMLDSVAQIKTQVDRCGNITQAILKFARQKEVKPKVMNLAEFIPQVLSMVDKKAAVEGIELSFTANGQTPEVNSDPGQLQQVLLNLINNAMDAVAEKHGGQGGKVRVRLFPEDSFTVVSVTDNGIGIGQQDLDRIFTPFFTTKPVGKGTGLGLPVCFGIVDKMGGSLKVESRLGEGTTFSVRLPAAS